MYRVSTLINFNENLDMHSYRIYIYIYIYICVCANLVAAPSSTTPYIVDTAINVKSITVKTKVGESATISLLFFFTAREC